jgi:hypothetical protein
MKALEYQEHIKTHTEDADNDVWSEWSGDDSDYSDYDSDHQ